MKFLRNVTVALSVVAGMLAIPGVSQAQETREVTETTSGASATCTVPADLSRIDCTLSDTASDSHPVFIAWEHGGGVGDRFKNDAGSGTTTDHGQGQLNQGDDYPFLNWKVCTDVQFGSDICSPVVEATGEWYEVICDQETLNSPPSASIPPEAQPKLNCYQTGGNLSSVPAKCLTGIALAVAGVGEKGLSDLDAKRAGKFAIKKVPGLGWVLTGAGVGTAVIDC